MGGSGGVWNLSIGRDVLDFTDWVIDVHGDPPAGIKQVLANLMITKFKNEFAEVNVPNKPFQPIRFRYTGKPPLSDTPTRLKVETELSLELERALSN